ncbi:MAG TPA: DUF4837 family protein, partial [Bacteroidales bacterium]
QTRQKSVGNTSEIMVVLQNDEQWEFRIGDVIREYLGQPQYGLNQAETTFKLSHITAGSFSELLQKHRNLIIVNIDDKAPKASIESINDYWAAPQQIFRITAPSVEAFVEVFEANATTIIRKFNESERNRIISVFKTAAGNKAIDQIRKDAGLTFVVPADYFVAKSEPGFMWVRKEAAEYSQGFVIISEEYQDTAQFSTASILSRTNRFLKQFVPGSVDSSYMIIDDVSLEPMVSLASDFLVEYAVEIRGLWKVENDFMGGPFVSYTFVNPNNNKIITLYGYVYKPNKEKRDLLKQVEAIMYSVSF